MSKHSKAHSGLLFTHSLEPKSGRPEDDFKVTVLLCLQSTAKHTRRETAKAPNSNEALPKFSYQLRVLQTLQTECQTAKALLQTLQSKGKTTKEFLRFASHQAKEKLHFQTTNYSILHNSYQASVSKSMHKTAGQPKRHDFSRLHAARRSHPKGPLVKVKQN